MLLAVISDAVLASVSIVALVASVAFAVAFAVAGHS